MPTTTTPAPLNAEQRRRRDALLERIAIATFGVETLATRNSDRLDFHDTAVWAMKEALEAAYDAGRAAAGKGR